MILIQPLKKYTTNLSDNIDPWLFTHTHQLLSFAALEIREICPQISLDLVSMRQLHAAYVPRGILTCAL